MAARQVAHVLVRMAKHALEHPDTPRDEGDEGSALDQLWDADIEDVSTAVGQLVHKNIIEEKLDRRAIFVLRKAIALLKELHERAKEEVSKFGGRKSRKSRRRTRKVRRSTRSSRRRRA